QSVFFLLADILGMQAILDCLLKAHGRSPIRYLLLDALGFKSEGDCQITPWTGVQSEDIDCKTGSNVYEYGIQR
ncbi:MAG: hypothetical protein ACQERT_15065, partial [Thermodesulfobacteriota bacterium]